MTSVRELWEAHKAKTLPDPKEKALANHRKYDRTKKGKETRKEVRKRRKQRESILVVDFSEEDWLYALEYFGRRCAYCESDKTLHRDHFIPVLLGGHTVKGNMVPSCRNCNTAKRELDPFEWLVCQEHGLIVYAKIMEYFQSVADRASHQEDHSDTGELQRLHADRVRD